MATGTYTLVQGVVAAHQTYGRELRGRTAIIELAVLPQVNPDGCECMHRVWKSGRAGLNLAPPRNVPS